MAKPITAETASHDGRGAIPSRITCCTGRSFYAAALGCSSRRIRVLRPAAD